MRIVLLAVTVLFLVGRALAGGIIIGHAEVMAVTNIPQAHMEQMAAFRWFFAHASVGDNMMQGITALHDSNTNRYRIQRQSQYDNPPELSACEPGLIYDYQRGNPDWSEKVQWFEQYASNGWHNPIVNICLNKFCWIDPYANADVYLQSMRELETRYPDTLFVYMTIPLTGLADEENNLRNAFNKLIRSFCTTNNRVLYDVADLEAHDTNGVAQMYATTNQMMYSGFAEGPGYDDWHLNAVGRPWVARGFYALGHALLTTDRDGDGESDGAELIAGTCPTNAASVMRLDAAEATATAGGLLIRWPGATNRTYTVQRMTHLLGAGVITNLASGISNLPTVNVYTDFPSGSGPWFYRVGVRQEP